MYRLLLVVIFFLMITGCKLSPTSNVSITSSPLVVTSTSLPLTQTVTPEKIQESTPVQTSTPIPTNLTPSPTASIETIAIAESDSNGNITLGEYAVANESPFNYGSAVVTSKGTGLYHINIEVVRLYSHHLGNIESDFNITSGKINLLDKEMTDVDITFSQNKLIIDYPESSRFGGANAEPKGTYYLKNTGIEDTKFLKELFDSVNLGESYRNGFTDVYVTALNGSNQLMLLQSKSSINRFNIVSEYVVVYSEKENKFNFIGVVHDIHDVDIKKISDKLKILGFEQDTIYRTLKKDANDRYINVRMNRFDNGEIDGIDKPLTDQEAFYVATGEEGKTGISDNRRDKNNIGSIFITEVDHSDDKTVTIHKYEDVRNDEKDTHTATSDWITVERLSGNIKGILEGN
ncbi:MAG: hypothetical protein JWM44_872 [Bacilli bacterium]|nr:hypothetical protein [Bacilli bacterium]